MLINLKLALLRKGIRQTRMAVDLGWDPAKLSRIINEMISATDEERTRIAEHLGLEAGKLFAKEQLLEGLGASPLRNSVQQDRRRDRISKSSAERKTAAR
ncbi:MAG: helix-turn-helix transcriptional regulator [Bryobacteraceae bacterium]